MNYIFALFISFSCFSQKLVSERNIEELIPQNPTVESLTQRVEAARVLQGSLGRSFLPKIQLTYGRERYTTGPYYHINQPYGGIEARINVFNSGKDQILNEQKKKGVELARIDEVITRVQLKAEIVKNLSQFAYLKELIEVIEEAKKINDKNLKSAENRINAGLSTKTDTLDFRQQGIMLSQQLTGLEFEKKVVQRIITTLLGMDPDDSISVNFINNHPEHVSITDVNLLSSKSLLVKRSHLMAEMAELEVANAKRWWTPSVDLYGYALRFTQKEREYPMTGQRNDAGIGFRLTFPIFDGGEGMTLARSKGALAQSERALAKQKSLEIERDMINAKSRLDLAHDLIHGAEENVKIMDEYRAGVLKDYSRGIKNSPDVLQASERWIQSKMNFAEVKKNYQFAKADAHYLFGTAQE